MPTQRGIGAISEFSYEESEMKSKNITHKNRMRGGFTLVELVVVVLVLGIIAAVAAPRMFDTAGDARQNASRHSLIVVRDAIELHRAQNGTYPPVATIATALRPFLNGPFPATQVGTNQNATVAASTQDPIAAVEGGGAGWAYNVTTGEIVINDAAFLTW
jgi:general secretion pathway protein G